MSAPHRPIARLSSSRALRASSRALAVCPAGNVLQGGKAGNSGEAAESVKAAELAEITLLETAGNFETRPVVLGRWGWPASIARLATEIEAVRDARVRPGRKHCA